MNFYHCGFFVLVFLVNNVLSQKGASCTLPNVKYGRVRSRQRGRVIKFVCQAGFQLAGERNAFCVNGTWDVPPPKCVRTTCAKKDDAPTNGLILPSHGGGVLNFYCKQGFDLHGPAAVFCDGFLWDNHMPSCIPSNTTPSLFCDFEDANICHWTHDLNHDMDWKRDSYKTPTGYSMETGPSYDHTKGVGENGHYMYIESSSRRINDTARLISPIFKKTTTNTCLEFWYHMFGRTTGSLRAYLRKVTDPWPLKPENALFTKTGNQGNVWLRGIVNLGIIDQDYQIIMEGVRGNGYVSDTAVDDIKIIENCVYQDYLLSTTEFPLPVSEILKSVDSCENRCGNKTSANEGSQSIISCDCDDYCYESSRCCPDFVDFCFTSSSTSDYDTTTETQSISEKLPVPSNSTVINITINRKNNTESPILIDRTTHFAVTMLRTTKRILPVTVPAKIPPLKVPQIQNNQSSIPKILPPKVVINKNQSSIAKIPIPAPTRRPLIIVAPPTTTVIYRKIFPNIPPLKNNSKITFLKPTIQPTNKNNYNDVLEVPTRQNIDEELLITSPLPVEDDNNVPLQDKEDYVEGIIHEKGYLENNNVYPEKLGEIKTEFRQSQSEMSNVKMIFVVIATVCGVATVAIISMLVLVKYRVVRFRTGRMMSGNGNSQSDVRFLTADEVLDFSLDNDDL